MTTSILDVGRRGLVTRAGKFGLVGVLGFGVNLVSQAAFTELGGIDYLVSAVLATQVSSTFNFVLAGGCTGAVTVTCPDPYTCVSS